MGGQQQPTKIRVLVADERALFRDALRAVLDREQDLEVVDEAADAPEAVDAAARCSPDAAILSASLPASDGPLASCLMKEQAPDCKILVLADSQDLRLLTDGLGCGASGYLTKDSSIAELVDALRAVVRGETLVPPVLLGPLLSDLIGRRRDHEGALLKLGDLSRREREVLGLLARGRRTAEIAEKLVITTETARTHIQHVLSKLGVHSRLEAAAFVIENGLLDHLAPPDALALQSTGEKANGGGKTQRTA